MSTNGQNTPLARAELQALIERSPGPVQAYARNYPADWDTGRHSHRRAQLVFATRGMMTVTVNLHLADPDKKAEIDNLRPRLTDRFIIALNRLGQTTIDIRRPLNYQMLERVLQRSTDQVLGEHVATVLIVDASTRAI